MEKDIGAPEQSRGKLPKLNLPKFTPKKLMHYKKECKVSPRLMNMMRESFNSQLKERDTAIHNYKAELCTFPS